MMMKTKMKRSRADAPMMMARAAAAIVVLVALLVGPSGASCSAGTSQLGGAAPSATQQTLAQGFRVTTPILLSGFTPRLVSTLGTPLGPSPLSLFAFPSLFAFVLLGIDPVHFRARPVTQRPIAATVGTQTGGHAQHDTRRTAHERHAFAFQT
jgi:hypothetical protein